MLVVVSDIHLVDEAARTVKPTAFRIFRDRIVSTAQRLWNEAGAARPGHIDIVLNGDILDYIRSDLWPSNASGGASVPRPWSKPRATFLPLIAAINDRILDVNAEALNVLKGLAAAPQCYGVPEEVDVQIHYLAGNHDWFLTLPSDPTINGARKALIDAFGLSPVTHSPSKPFPHDPMTDCPALLQTMKQHRVLIRHGDVHDPMNYSGSRHQSSVGDAIVIELLNALPHTVTGKLKKVVTGRLLRLIQSRLQALENLRPYSALPSWLESLLGTVEAAADSPAVADSVFKAINDSFSALSRKFRKLDLPKECAGTVQRIKAKAPMVVSQWLGMRLPALQQLIMEIALEISADERRYRDAAYHEQLLREGAVDYVVYGHTHHHGVHPLDNVVVPAAAGPGTLRAWYYVNSGTWRPVHEPCIMHPSQREFAFYYTMTYLLFFTPAERREHSFDCWSGVLTSQRFSTHASADMYLLEGKLIDRRERCPLAGSSGYRVALYDRDIAFNDPLGEVLLDDQGSFRIGFFANEFRGWLEGTEPDPLLVVRRRGKEVASLRLKWPRYATTKRGDVGTLEVDV